MTDRYLPSRVILSHDDSYCEDSNCTCSAKFETGLSAVYESQWNKTWCFCGAASDKRLWPMEAVNMTHCHLLGVKALNATGCGMHKKYQHLGVDDRSNGRTDCSLRKCLLLDGGRPCDAAQLATVTCSYGIPSNVECLDLAVGCLQRISGSYFINRKLLCVMSVCKCHTRAKNAVDKAPNKRKAASPRRSDGNASRKKSTKKPHKCNLPTVCELESLYSAESPPRDDKSSNLESEQRERCTRSTSKKLIASCSVSAADDDAHVASVTQSAAVAESDCDPCEHSADNARDSDVSPVVTRPSSCCLTCDSVTDVAPLLQCHVTSDVVDCGMTADVSPARKTKSLSSAADGSAADGDNIPSCGTDRSTAEVAVPAVTAGTRSLTKCRRRQQKVVVNKKRMRHGILCIARATRILRSHTSLSLALTAGCSNRRHEAADDSTTGHVKTSRLRSSKLVQIDAPTSITADCEVLVSRLAVHGSCTRKTRKVGQPRKQLVPTVPTSLVNDTAVPSRHADNREMTCNGPSVTEQTVDSAADSQVISYMTDSENVDRVASERQINCEVSKLSALYVDVDYNDVCHSPTSLLYSDICSSPASPLPVSCKITASEQCRNVVERAALLLRRRSVCLVVCTVTATGDNESQGFH